MRNKNGLTLIALVIAIMVIVVLAGVTLKLTIGNDGVLTRAQEVEIEYNKNEVLEELNEVIKEKYLQAYKESSGKNISDYYNEEKVIEFFIEKGYIEKLKNLSNEEIDNKYFINISALKRNITKYSLGKNGSEGNGKDLFYIDTTDSSAYLVNYVSPNGEVEEVGKLQIEQEL